MLEPAAPRLLQLFSFGSNSCCSLELVFPDGIRTRSPIAITFHIVNLTFVTPRFFFSLSLSLSFFVNFAMLSFDVFAELKERKNGVRFFVTRIVF